MQYWPPNASCDLDLCAFPLYLLAIFHSAWTGITGLNGGAQQPLPTSIFESTAGVPSADESVFKGIMKKNSCNTFSGLSKNIIPAVWSLALQLDDGIPIDSLSQLWQSVLLVVGDILQHKKVVVCVV